MTYVQRLLEKLNAGLHAFVSVLINANRDFPYHDYETATTTATKVAYEVGENNRGLNAEQNKLFVSKSTLMYCTTNTYVNLNSPQNVDVLLIANNFYTFKSNIKSVFYRYVASEGIIYIWAEGVLPQEARGTH